MKQLNISFGMVKALGNLLTGRLADQFGRRRILIAGWLAGLPVPVIVIFAPHWKYRHFLHNGRNTADFRRHFGDGDA